MSEADCIKVAVRCRPLRNFEVERGAVDNVFKAVGNEAILNDPTNPGAEPRRFAFDFVYDGTSTQDQVYRDNVTPLLDKAFAGFNATVFAYGQTGAGKSWTMSGNAAQPGIIPRMSSELFQKIEVLRGEYAAQGKERFFMVEAAFFELYNEQVFDLLVPKVKAGAKRKNLMLRETKQRGVFVDGLNELVVKSEQEIADIIRQGNENRSVGATSMNAESSRSHSIFTLKIHQREPVEAAGGKEIKIFSKINLVDLAGSERSSKTNATGARLKEGANINKSLTTLGTVINTLAKNAGLAAGKKGDFVPYRNSKLTRVLQESLGGNSLTVMIAALSPASDNFAETLGTLKYADRAKAIQLTAVKNDNSEQVAKLLNEIEELKRKLAEGGGMDEAKKKEMEAQFAAEKEEMARQAREAWAEKERQTQEFERRRQQMAEQAQAAEDAQKQQAVAERRRRLGVVATKNDLSLTMEELPGACPSLSAAAAAVEALQAKLRDQLLTLKLYRDNFAKDVQRWPTANASPTVMRLDRLRGTFGMLNDAVAAVSALQAEHAAAASKLEARIARALEVLQDPEKAKAAAGAAAGGGGDSDGDEVDEWIAVAGRPLAALNEAEVAALAQSEADDARRADAAARAARAATQTDAVAVLTLLGEQLTSKRAAVAEAFLADQVTAIAEEAVLRRLGEVGTTEAGGLDKLLEEQKEHSSNLRDVVNSVEDEAAKVELRAKAESAAAELKKYTARAAELRADLEAQTAALLGVVAAGGGEQAGAARAAAAAVEAVVGSMGRAIDWRLSVQESLAEQSQEQLLASKENMIGSLQRELAEANKLMQQLHTDLAQGGEKLRRKDEQLAAAAAAAQETLQQLADARREAQGASAQRDAAVEEFREREVEMSEDAARAASQIVDLKDALEAAGDRDARQSTEVAKLRVAVEELRNANFAQGVKLEAADKAAAEAARGAQQREEEAKLQATHLEEQLTVLRKEHAKDQARAAALEEEKAAAVEAERQEKWKIKETLDKLQRDAAQQGGDANKLVEELQARVAELERGAEAAAAATAAAEAARAEAAEELDAARADAQRQVKAEQDKAALQESKHQSVAAAGARAAKQVEELKAQLEASASAQRQMERGAADAAEQAAALERRAADAAEQADQFESQRADAAAVLHSVRKEAAARKAEVELAHVEIENQKRAVEAREAARKQAVADLRAAERECEARVQRLEDQMDELREAERKALEAVARMEGEVKRAQVYNFKLQKAVELSDKSQSGGVGATDILKLEDKASRLSAQLERSEVERKRLAEVETAFHEQKLELGAARIKAKKLESQVDDLEGQVYQLGEEHDEALATKTAELEKQQAAAAEAKEEAEYELQQLQDEVAELKDQVKAKGREVEAARRELQRAAAAPPHPAGSAVQAARARADSAGAADASAGDEDYGADDDFD